MNFTRIVSRILAGAFAAAALAAPLCVAAQAQTIERPVIRAGDSWVYRDTMERAHGVWTQTRDEALVTRVTASTIYFTTREVGSPANVKERLATLEWGRTRDVNGKETLVNQPLAFPLVAGKTWDVHFTEKQPNPQHLSEDWATKCTATGMEPIEVAAGKFQAMKIECEGSWTAELAPAHRVVQSADSTPSGISMRTDSQRITPRTSSGRIYKAFWYVPEVKRFVKQVEETYDSSGIRSESLSAELESYKLAN